MIIVFLYININNPGIMTSARIDFLECTKDTNVFDVAPNVTVPSLLVCNASNEMSSLGSATSLWPLLSVGWLVGQSQFPRRLGSYTSMLLSENLFPLFSEIPSKSLQIVVLSYGYIT